MQPITFITSFLTAYLKGEISQNGNLINLKVPNTILTFIPLGCKNDTVPVRQIAGVNTNFKLLFKSFLTGVVIAIIGLACMGQSFFVGLLLFVIGAFGVLNSFQTELDIVTAGGEHKLVNFIIFQKAKAEEARQALMALINAHDDDRNVKLQNETVMAANAAQTDRMIDAINNLKKD